MPRGRIFLLLSAFFFFNLARAYPGEEESTLFWPRPPAEMRIAFVKSVYSPAELGIKAGFFKKLKRAIFGEEKDVLGRPVAIAVDSQKTIYVCDTKKPALYILIPKEKGYKKITAVNNQELLSPVAVAVSDNRLVFIADSELKKVFCLDQQGRYKFTVGPDKMFQRPTGLVISKDKLYVADTSGNNISIFDLTGKFISEFGRRGDKEGEFNYPTAIAADSAGKIYVVDALNFRVEVFNAANNFLYSIGEPGDSSGSFSRPKAVALDSFGHIYVTDGMFDNIQIFDQKKRFLLSLGESGNKNGEFWIPCGIAVDKDNYIYIADAYNQRVQILHYLGKE